MSTDGEICRFPMCIALDSRFKQFWKHLANVY
jgi:hypothetical protein